VTSASLRPSQRRTEPATHSAPNDDGGRNSGRDPTLDAVRGIAALLVVLGHTREMLFGVQGLPATGVGWQRIALLPTALAQESVAIFFVLSGYLVGGQVLRLASPGAGRFPWRLYLTNRLTRLWAALLPALLLTLFLDRATATVSASAAGQVLIVPARSGLATLGCNAIFLQRSRCATLGSNDALWSLSYEFWFYVVFAAAAAAVQGWRRRSATAVLLSSMVLVASLAVFGVGLLALMPAWLLGASLAAWQSRRPRRSSPRVALVAAGTLLGALLLSNVLTLGPATRFALIGACATPGLHVITTARRVRTTGVDHSIVASVAFVGTWSYTLYVVHQPIVGLLVVLNRFPGGTARQVASVYAVALAATVLAYPMSFVGERQTARLRSAAQAFATLPGPSRPPPRDRAQVEAQRPTAARRGGPA
jgi:peptidoglycan/LPS O-acetylase OafA/YrhL